MASRPGYKSSKKLEPPVKSPSIPVNPNVSINTIENILEAAEFSKEHISQILQITESDSTLPYVNVSNYSFLYELIPLLKQNFVAGINLINNLSHKYEKFQKIPTIEIFNSELFLEQKLIYTEDIIKSQMKLTVFEGLIECPKCGSKFTTSYGKQNNSGDESCTYVNTCTSCHNRWNARA